MLAELTLCACFVLSEPGVEPPAAREPNAVDATATTAQSTLDNQQAQQKPTDEELLAIERNIILYTNRERTKRGLPALAVDEKLMKSARAHTVWMTRHRSLVHTNGPVAENIAMGQRNSREAVGDWMNSSGHRANILTRGFRRIGVAAYRASNGTIYWCQQFRH